MNNNYKNKNMNNNYKNNNIDNNINNIFYITDQILTFKGRFLASTTTATLTTIAMATTTTSTTKRATRLISIESQPKKVSLLFGQNRV